MVLVGGDYMGQVAHPTVCRPPLLSARRAAPSGGRLDDGSWSADGECVLGAAPFALLSA